MDGLPNRDTVAAFEARLGKPLTSVLVWLMATALAVGSLGVIIAGVRAAYGFFYPMLPDTGWWAGTAVKVSGAVVAALVAVLAKVVNDLLQYIRQLKRVDTNAQAIAQVVAAESQVAEQTEKRLTELEQRFKYVENKVGGELSDLITKRMLEAQGITVDDLGRVKQLPELYRITQKEKIRLEHARALLREAAERARGVEDAWGDLDKANTQAWLALNIGTLVGEILTFDAYNEFRDYQNGRIKKREQHGRKANGREALLEDAAYLEKLANRLNFEDVDPKLTFRRPSKRGFNDSSSLPGFVVIVVDV